MMSKQAQAQQILESKLLDELLESYKWMQFESWAAQPDKEQREALYAKINAVNDVHSFLQNKCEGILRGH